MYLNENWAHMTGGMKDCAMSSQLPVAGCGSRERHTAALNGQASRRKKKQEVI